MTVSSDLSQQTFACDGVTTVFAQPYRVLDAAEVRAYLITIATNVSVELTNGVDFVVTSVGAANAVVTTTLTYSSAYQLKCRRQTARLQLTDYRDNDPFPAESHEEALDRLTHITQEQDGAISRAILFPEPELGQTLPAAAVRANTVPAFDANGDLTVLAPVSGSAADVLIQLANTSDTSKADALVGVKRTLTGASATNQHAVNDARQVDPTIDFGVPNDGVTSATAAIQAMFNAVATTGISDIVFPPGTYLLTNPRNDFDYTCAVVISGLRDCKIRGSKGTKFIVNATGIGAAEFGMFRVEQCERLEFCHFEMDGSGITITGTGSNRSRGFVLVNYDVNAKATNLAVTNKQIEFHHINVHDIGEFVGVPPRSAILPAATFTDTLTVRNCIGAGLIGQGHFVGVTHTRNIHIHSNRVINPLTLTAHVGNLFCDISAGCVNAMVENNYAVGFTGGAKAETHILQGPALNEDRPSQNVTFRNNTFEQCGDPILIIYPGPSGGGWYGIKLNGINHSAYGNTITARSTNVSTGGLYQGVQSTNTAVVETLHTITGNDIRGTVIGINHDSPSDPPRRFVANISGNKIRDTLAPTTPISTNDGAGIIASRNALVENNDIYRSAYSAIMFQSPDQTIARFNFAYDCASVDIPSITATATFYQAGAGAQGFWEFTGNTILDARGASAAEYGYHFEAGTTYTNKYIINPGPTESVQLGVTFDKYFSYIGTSLALDGVTVVGPRTIYTTNTPTAIAPWSGMAWRVGDRAVNKTPVVGSAKAWSCTVAGTPGTWVSEGNL